MTLGEELINIIDRRIDIYLKKSQFICEYPGIIIDITIDNYAFVMLPAQNVQFKLPIREGLIVEKGDSVVVKCKMNDFTNAIITEKFIRG